MRLLLFPIMGLLGSLLTASCHSDTKQAATTGSLPTAATAPAVSPDALNNSPGASCRQYRGQLFNSPDSVTLNLLASPRRTQDAEFASLLASYTGPDGHPYQLVSYTSTSPDSILLRDISPEVINNQREGANWRLLRQGEKLVGTHNGQIVQLHEVHPATSLEFAVRYFSDSVVAFTDVAKSPKAHFSLQVLLPKKSFPALTANILRDVRGDTIPDNPIASLPQLWALQSVNYRKMYREDAAENRKGFRGSSAELADLYALRYEQQQATYVLWNQAPWLSLGFYTYDYTGGAHGNYVTQTATYDTRTGQRLRFADIFRPGTDAQLIQLLNQAVRRTLHIPANHPLDERLFVKTMPVTHNVYLTAGGAVFVYTTYEIASYAQGEIPVFIPLADLKPLMLLHLPA